MRIYLGLFIFLYFGLTLSESAFARKKKSVVKYIQISEVVANPSKFEGKKVYLEGCLNLEFESNAIYPDINSCERNYKKGLWVSLSEKFQNFESPHRRRLKVKVEGVVASKDNGHMGLWPAALHNVKIISSEEVKEKK